MPRISSEFRDRGLVSRSRRVCGRSGFARFLRFVRKELVMSSRKLFYIAAIGLFAVMLLPLTAQKAPNRRLQRARESCLHGTESRQLHPSRRQSQDRLRRHRQGRHHHRSRQYHRSQRVAAGSRRHHHSGTGFHEPDRGLHSGRPETICFVHHHYSESQPAWQHQRGANSGGQRFRRHLDQECRRRLHLHVQNQSAHHFRSQGHPRHRYLRQSQPHRVHDPGRMGTRWPTMSTISCPTVRP